MKKIFLSVFALVGVLSAILLFKSPDHSVQDTIVRAQPDLSSHSDSQLSPNEEGLARVSSLSALGYESRFGDLPVAWDGVYLLDGIATDAQGNLRISQDVRDLFDVFLASIELESLDIVLGRIDEFLEYHLASPALEQARDLLSDYVALKQALYELEASAPSPVLPDKDQPTAQRRQHYLSALREQLDQRNLLRQQYLGDEVYEAFYAEEAAYDEFTYDRMVLISDPDISAEEREVKLNMLEQALPEHVRAARVESALSTSIKQQTESLRSKGASSEEIYTFRQQEYGQQAAERFAALDESRAEWDRRIDQYTAQRDRIFNAEGLSDQDKQSQIEALRAQHFEGRELIRVRAMDLSQLQKAS